jgi:hypothetical protein
VYVAVDFAVALVQVILALMEGFVLQAAWDPTVDVERYAIACTAVVDAYLSPPTAATATPRAQR